MNASTRAAVPSHVPPDLVYAFDQFGDSEFAVKPYAVLERVRREAPPIFFIPPHEYHFPRGTWCFTRADDAREALQHPELFTREDILNESNFGRRIIPLDMDPPEHGKYRAILNPHLSPRAIDRLEGEVKIICNTLLDKIEKKGECEFMRDFARPYPATVFMKLMGLPMEMQEAFVEWERMALNSATREETMEGSRRVGEFLEQVIEERRKKPQDDLITKIAHAEIDGKPMKLEYIHDMCFLLFLAGLDTVTAGLMHIFRFLGSHPDRKKELMSAPDLIPSAVEEMLRYHAWVPSERTVTQDLEFRGVQMKRGDHVHLLSALASHDPAEYADPEQIDFRREHNPHFAFAAGVHRCAGSHLARRELRVGVAEWLRRMPDFHVVRNNEVRYVNSIMFLPEALHLRWTPKAS